MADHTDGQDEAALAAIARHALHDEELVAAYAADDLADPPEIDRARALVERCSTCRDLHRDLVGVRAAIRASGNAAERALTMTAPRDFRISIETAERLRPGSPIARVATRLGLRARLALGVIAYGRPVGAALATFGLVGLLIGSLTFAGGPASLSGPGAGAGAPAGAPAGADASSAAGSELHPVTLPGATGSFDRNGAYGPLATSQPVGDTKGSEGPDRLLSEPAQSAMLLGGSIAILVLGIAMFIFAERRRRRT